MSSIYSLKNEISIHYFQKYLSQEKAKKLYDLFEGKMIYNTEEQSMVRIHGKYIKIPRKQVAYGKEGTEYNFTGNKVKARSYDENDEISLEIKKLITNLNSDLGRQYNFVLINRYEDGNQYIGPHSDDERDLIEDYTIAGISLGAERNIVFTKGYTIKKETNTKSITNWFHNEKHDELPDEYKLKLENGSLFVMYQPTNKKWKHSIPKVNICNQPRISLTFREMK
jgi:alpha-ketoglutarate-dependent dioxygenase alkB family protein 2